MITKAQIKLLCYPNWHSALVYARLDKPYIIEHYTIPEGTIVQLKLFKNSRANLMVNGLLGCKQFPYDAATLLNPPIIPESKTMRALPAFAVVVLFGLLMYLGASLI